MLHILAIILTIDLFWTPNPTEQKVTGYEILISTNADMTAPQLIPVGNAPSPDGKMHYLIPNWNTAVVKYAAVRAVNPIGVSALTAPVRVGEPEAPVNLGATKAP